MNVIFAGYRKWAYQILINLLEVKSDKWNVKAIITNKKPESAYDSLSIPCLNINPKLIGSQENIQFIKKFKPDVLFFCGWSWILPKQIYDALTCLILHTSPLPKYRGGSPLQHQIIAGERNSAISIIKAVKELDKGGIYAQMPFSLDGSMDQIFKRIVKVATESSLRVFDGLADRTLRPVVQDESCATYFKRRKPNESELKIDDFKTKTAKELYNFIRALADPYPNAYIVCKDGKKLYFTGAKIDDDKKNQTPNYQQ